MRMRRRVLAVLIGATLAIGIAACSEGDDTPGTNPPDTTVPSGDTSSTEPIGS
jgi:hypothetical protein